MEFDQVIRTRSSIRKFKPDPVSDEMINQILEAARLAPSGSNVQPWRFVVVKSAEMRRKLEAATRYRFALRAPVLFVCCANKHAIEARDKRIMELLQADAFTDVEIDDGVEVAAAVMDAARLKTSLSMNVAIAVEHMALKAADLGLGSCWIGGFDVIKAKEILELDDDLYLIALLPVGYPAQDPKPRPRLSMEELVVKTV
ncbi:MAG: oxidoreductase [Proteobacteria bacterium]|nr:oxidoreductase [Pseudomonadota bacterium]